MATGARAMDQVLAMRSATPGRIEEITAGAEPALLRTSHSIGEWSANAVLAHLRACGDVWGGRILSILVEDRPTLKAANPATWIRSTGYLDLEFEPSLLAYTAQRAAQMAVPEPLPDEAWSRTATVTGAGKVLERTVLFYANWLARHERPHVGQIGHIASRRLADDRAG